MRVKLIFVKPLDTSPCAYEPDYKMCLCVEGVKIAFPGAFSVSNKCILEVSSKSFGKGVGELIRVTFGLGDEIGEEWKIVYIETENGGFCVFTSTAIQGYNFLKSCGFLAGEKWNGKDIKLWVRKV